MLRNLWIENFRALEDFKVARLGRVNLIVGKNSSGKSTVLEALRIFSRRANPSLLSEIAIGHDETFRGLRRDEEAPSFEAELPFQHFFPKRVIPQADSVRITIGDLERKEFVSIEHILYLQELIETTDSTNEVVRRARKKPIAKSDLFGRQRPDGQALSISAHDFESPTLIDLEDFDSYRYRPRLRTAPWYARESPVSYIPTQFLPFDSLAALWDRIALTELEKPVLEALSVIEPDIERLTFVSNDTNASGARVREGTRIPVIKLAGIEKPVPLSSTGDGMVRTLQMVLGIFPAKDGLFLVDEFENGLHYSVQEKIWALIFRLAGLLNVQVFATTHSWDCVESFKNAAIANEDDGILFRMARSVLPRDHGKIIATVFDEESLDQVTQAKLEIR